MPRAELEEQNVATEDEVLAEDEVLEDDETELEDELEDEDEDGKPKKKRVRKLFSESNQYYFPITKENPLEKVKEQAKEGLLSLTYQDNSKVTGFRVFNVIKDAKKDEDGETIDGEIIGQVLGRNQDNAARNYCESIGMDLDLAYKRRRGPGRGRVKIEQTALMYGKLLESLIFDKGSSKNDFKKDAPKRHIDDWNSMYAAGARYGHYRNENGDWKEATHE